PFPGQQRSVAGLEADLRLHRRSVGEGHRQLTDPRDDRPSILRKNGYEDGIALGRQGPAFLEMPEVLEAATVVRTEDELIPGREMETGIAHGQRAPIPARRLQRAIGGLEPEGRCPHWMSAERDGEVSQDWHLFRASRRVE